MRIRQNHRAYLTALPSHHARSLPYDFYYTIGMECLGLEIKAGNTTIDEPTLALMLEDQIEKDLF